METKLNSGKEVTNYKTFQDNNSIDEQDEIVQPTGWGARHTFVLMSFFGFTMQWALRNCLNVAIVAMVNSEYTNENVSFEKTLGQFNVSQFCSANISDNRIENVIKNSSGYNWNNFEQGLIIGSLQIGSVITLIPGGYLAEKFGGKHIIGVATFYAGFVTLVIPRAASRGLSSIIGIRVLKGMFQGVILPAYYCMMSKWIPLNERSKMMTIIWSGSSIGTTLSHSLTGYFCDTIGWEFTFYFFGIVGTIFAGLWYAIAVESPEEHSNIEKSELKYILSGKTKGYSTKNPKAPIVKMLCSGPVWALILSTFGFGCGYFSLLNQTPIYLDNVLHMSNTMNGILSGLPNLFLLIFSLPVSLLADWSISSQRISTGVVRKICSGIGLFGPALCALALSFKQCNLTWSLTWLSLSMMFVGANHSGINVNPLELSPNYAGTVRGLVNTFYHISAFMAPIIAGYLTQTDPSLSSWSWIFQLSSGALALSGIIFCLFGSSNLQSWDEQLDEDEKNTFTNSVKLIPK